METYSALYYPFIHFKDDRWVKLAALYWDRLGRIVPQGYTTEDSDTVRALGQFIQTLRPDWVRPQFGETFVEFVDQYGDDLRGKYHIDFRTQWGEVPPERRPPLAGGPSGTDPRLGYVFYEKMSEEVRKALMNSRIALPDQSDPRWIGMHPKLALVYMTALADQLAGEQGLYPLTDETVDHLAVSGCTLERLAQALLDDVNLVGNKANAREVETVAASISLQTVLPHDIGQVPIDKILSFRDKYPAERAAFQEGVADFVKPREWLKDVKDPQALSQRLQDEYDKEFKPKVVELRDKLREVGIDAVWGCFNVKTLLPPFVGVAAPALGLTLNPLAAALAGIAWGLIPVLRDKRKIMKETLRSSPVAYLMRVEEELKPQTLKNWIWRDARKFCFDV